MRHKNPVSLFTNIRLLQITTTNKMMNSPWWISFMSRCREDMSIPTAWERLLFKSFTTYKTNRYEVRFKRSDVALPLQHILCVMCHSTVHLILLHFHWYGTKDYDVNVKMAVQLIKVVSKQSWTKYSDPLRKYQYSYVKVLNYKSCMKDPT